MPDSASRPKCGCGDVDDYVTAIETERDRWQARATELERRQAQRIEAMLAQRQPRGHEDDETVLHAGCPWPSGDCDCISLEELRNLRAERDGYRAALETIKGPSDSGIYIGAYREAGGGYEGLQAVARVTLKDFGALDRSRGLTDA